MKLNTNLRWRWLGAWRQTGLVLFIYTVLTVVMTWPIAGRLGTHIPGMDGDAWIHLWTFRWVRDAILSGKSPYFTNLLFYPNGSSLYSHNIAWLNIAAWLPLQALFGEATAYSLIFLAVIVLNGFATYLLALELTGSKLAAFVGGLIVAFWPYALSHQDHPNLIFITWIPLALLYLKRFLDHRQKHDFVLAALFIALIGITRWQLLILGGLLIGLYLLYRIVTDKLYREPRALGYLVAIGLLAGLIMLPLMLPIFLALSSETVPLDLFVESQPHSADLLSFLVPSKYHLIWGEAVSDFYEVFPFETTVPFLGYSVLLLAIVGIGTRWTKARIWLLVALLYMTLSLGSKLYINGNVIDMPMPYSLIADSVFMQMIRRPIRFNVILSIPIAILASFGILALRQRVRPKWLSIGLASAIIALILGEFIVSYRTLPLETPVWYSELAKESGEFGVLGIPMSPAQSYKTYMYYQFTHGKPIVQAHVSRVPSEASSFISDSLLLRKVRYEKMQVLAGEIVNVSEQLRQLAVADIRYLILHKQFLQEDDLHAWQSWLGHDPYHEDYELAVYRTDPLLGRDFSLLQELTTNSDGDLEIGLIRASFTPTSTIQGGTIDVQANWYAGSDVEQDYHLCFILSAADRPPLHSSCQPLSTIWPTSNWQAGEQFFTKHSIQASPYLNSGLHTLSLALVDEDHSPINDSIADLDSLDLSALPRTFSKPEPSQRTNATWDNLIFLSGFDLSYPDPDSLAVHVFWQANDRMDTSYTNFFHLVDPGTGQVVTQADVIPRGWTYPTNWWEQGELVEDTVRLSLEGVPPGEYDLFVGWYNMENGERLPAYSETGELFAGDSVPLITIKR